MSLQTGPKIFIHRLLENSDLPDDTFLCNPDIRSVKDAENLKNKKIIARLDGTSYYKMTGKNLYGFLKQRKPRLSILLFWIKYLPTLPLSFSKFINKYLDRGALWLLKNADGLIFQSELSKEMHRKFLGYSEENIKSTIIFNGVSTELFSPDVNKLNIEGYPKVLISASEYRPHKRLQDAIRLINNMSSSYPMIKLHVIGNLDNLSKKIVEKLDTSRCVFHGKLNVSDLPSMYASCDLQLSLSIFDPCPNVVCEGLASGLPVITPTESGAYELIGDENKSWSVNENLDLDYKTLHTPDKIAQIPLDKYSNVLDNIVKNLDKNKILARERALKFLDINLIRKKYIEFMQKI